MTTSKYIRYAIIGGISVSCCLLSLIGFAQDRLTYGVEVGVGSSQLITGRGSSSETIITPQADYYARMRFEDGGGDIALQLGGYTRYYWTRALFVQSGINYSHYGGRMRSTTRSFLPTDLPLEHGWQPGYHFASSSVRHHFHQVEVPLLLGVRIAQQLRFYAGPTLGVNVRAGTQTDLPVEYQWSHDPFFGNLRLGIGADMRRLSLDIHYQETLTYNNSALSVDRLSPNNFSTSVVTAGYGIPALASVIVKVGYRLP